MERYLIDTNVVTDYLIALFPATGLQFMDAVMDEVPNISVITQIELLSWKTDAAIEQQMKNFITDSVIVNISSDVIEHCVHIRRSKKIKTPDAIIAATALAYNYTLITNNEKDFDAISISGFKIINPYKM